MTTIKNSVSVNPRDLCIGNLVTDEFYKDFYNIIKVESIDNEGINLDIVDDGNWPEVAQRWVEPDYKFSALRAIPISEELLLNLGAVKLSFKDFPCFNLKGMQINFVNGLWIEYVSRIEIKGLHHLQNIFYFRKAEYLDVSMIK
jgi:hypothetical protein